MQLLSEGLLKSKYRFPIDKIPLGSKVAIWGAGRVGRELYQQNNAENYCNIVLWVDCNWENIDNDVVKNPHFLKEVTIDYVIVAVDSKNYKIAGEIKEILLEYQIPFEKIVGPIREYVLEVNAQIQKFEFTSQEEIDQVITDWFLTNEMIPCRVANQYDVDKCKVENPVCIYAYDKYRDLANQLIEKGMHRKNIYSARWLYLILKGGFNSDVQGVELKTDTKHYLITGAGFHNSGAQAMLFTVIENIKKKDPNAFIWFLPNDNKNKYSREVQKKFRFCFWLDDWDDQSMTWELLTQLTAIIDVSGYVLHSKGNVARYENILQVAYDYRILIYLMPQSFGPFEFGEDKKKLLKILLDHVERIYAREKNGYELMVSTFDLDNIQMADDIVLTDKEQDYVNVFSVRNNVEIDILPESVAVVPNSRLIEYADESNVLDIYESAIKTVLDCGKKVYIINHASDMEICRNLYERYVSDRRVILIDRWVDAAEFPKIVSKFDFIVASRYHAIVQGYKKRIPAVVIGWADKYVELMSKFEQQEYCFDIRDSKSYVIDMSLVIRKMTSSYADEQSKIHNGLEKLNNGCFKFLNND